MKKRTKKLIALTLALLMAATSLLSCKKDKLDDDNNKTSQNNNGEGEVVEKPQILTNVYAGKEVNLPEEYGLSTGIAPIYNKETGEIKLFCQRGEEILDENGEYIGYKVQYRLLTIDKDMNIVSENDIDLGTDENGSSVYVNEGVMTDDALYFLNNTYRQASDTQDFFICSYNFATKTTTTSQSLVPLFQNADPNYFYINMMTRDTDGNFYLVADEEIVVLNSEFVKQYSVTASNWIQTLTAAPNGKVYITSYFGADGTGMAEIDKAKQSISAPIPLGNSSNGNVFFGDGYSFYNVDGAGVYGINVDETTQETVSTMLMNFLNSDINSSRFEVLQIIDPETFLASERNESWETSLVLYKKTDDVDLSKVTVIDIAIANSYVPQELNSQIISYNKANRGKVRLTLTNYDKFATTEDYYAGYTKLATDIVNGLYKPDIIVNHSGNSTVSDVIVDRGLFVDLNTLIAKEAGLVDDIFDCVKRTYSTTDGKMWGICDAFQVQTLMGKTELLGGMKSWTLEEFLDFAKKLPAGMTLSEDFVQEVFLSPEVTMFYEPFIDMEKNTCDFNNPKFVKLLEFIASLPTAESKQNSGSYDYSMRDENRYENYQTGKTVLYALNLYDIPDILESERVFLTKDTTMIGFPSENGLGGVLDANDEFIITSYCEDVNSAWDFVKSYVAPSYTTSTVISSNRIMRMRNGISILKSIFDQQCEEYYQYEYEFSFDGSSGWGTFDPENPKDPTKLSSPGIVTYFREEDAAKLKDYVNNYVGLAIKGSIPSEVMAIIAEEVSSYTGGAKRAEDCAAVIQSRVNIWLAEHAG